MITINHGHALLIPAADFVAPAMTTYDIKGTNMTHTHTVTLSAAQLMSLAAGTSVTVKSTNVGHEHDVTIVCA